MNEERQLAPFIAFESGHGSATSSKSLEDAVTHEVVTLARGERSGTPVMVGLFEDGRAGGI